MTPEQINRAIAQACGWRSMPFDHWLDPQGEVHGCFGAGDEQKFLPNYHGDLNATVEATKTLTEDQYWPTFYDHLSAVTGGDYSMRKMNEATAAQRSEAFLKTLGLWEESKP